MKIALTGGSGGLGTAITEQALARGDTVVSIDRAMPKAERAGVQYVVANIMDYDAVLAAISGCDALIHMAAIPSPEFDPDHIVHNNNVVGSYNAMRGAVEAGITRICQASSVNAVGFAYGREAHFDYFPLDERHANYAEDSYALSKWICEQQADALCRRYETLSIASLRFHWVVRERALATKAFDKTDRVTAKNIWGYTLREAAARACLLGIEGRFIGHEAFYIVAPDTRSDTPSLELARECYPDVPVTGDLSGNRSFFDCSKAERILGWRHDEAAVQPTI